MDKVQQQLQEFRQRKLREEQANAAMKAPSAPAQPNSAASSYSGSSSPATSTANRNADQPSLDIDRDQPHRQRTWIDALTSFLIQLLVWLLLLLVAVKFEFGIVYCILSGFYVIWINLSRRRRQAGELSAYSVFNPNCERLPGTLTAEQLEGELLHRPM